MKTLTYEQAKEKALNMLTFRAHSEKELLQKLKQKGARDDDSEKIIEFCKEYNLIDDRDYAIRKAKDLRNLKKFGKKRIQVELKQLGIDAEYIDEAVSQLDDADFLNDDDVIKKLNGDFSKKSTDRAIRYFLNRGYDFYRIKECIERITENEI